MKKFMTDIKTLAALLMAGAAFTACSSSDDNTFDEQPVNPAKQTYTLTVKASKGGDATTRALTLTGEGNKTLKAYWDGTETVTVKEGGTTLGTLTVTPDATDNTQATLSGELDAAPSGTALTLELFSDAYNSQDGTLDYIASHCDYATATTTVTYDEVNKTIRGTDADFTNQQAIIKFTLQDKDNGNAAISPSDLTVDDGTNTVELTSILDATYTANGGDGVLYVAFPAAGSAKTVTLTATVGDDTYTYEKSGATFVNGQYYEITVKMTKQAAAAPAVTDLSMVDCAGNARANGMWTANCYMVHSAGDYKLPLVYGNAIKNGAANTVAYNPGEMTTTNPYCANFVNHAGEAINAPWITKSTSGEGVNKGMGITVTQAELLWQDAEGLITDVGISEDGDYLTLTVGKNATTQEGNALIAAKDANGTIVWSWHIWVTNQTFATLTDINTGSYTYTVTPVNLGWVGDATSTTGYCPYYQWGRKDAFIPSTGTGKTNHTVYNISNATVTGFSHTDDNSVTIGGNIQHPTVHNYNDDDYGPCNTQYYNMWDAQQTSDAENTAAATKKTVYDPCPPGFCVPTSGLYKYIGSQTRPTFNKGYTYSGVFFPASGYRGSSSGGLSGVGTGGRYWSATPIDGTYGRYFYFSSSSWLLNFDTRTYGFPVRAVAE